MPDNHRLRLVVATSLSCGLVASVAAGCASSAGTEPASSRSTAAGEIVQVSVSRCGSGWRPGAAGRQRLVLHNADSRAGEAQLVGVDTGSIYADVEPFGPDTHVALDLRLPAGRYAVRCLMEDEAAVVGPTVTVHGEGRGGAPGVRPVTQDDLIGPTQGYERYVRQRLTPLSASVGAMSRDIAGGHRAAARTEWLEAHLAYERLGAAYDAFGDLDARINGLPDGLPDGVHDPHWTGFHRVELGLWHHEHRRGLLAAAETLHRDVSALARHVATTRIDPVTMAIRAHEISEDALQLQLGGRSDFGSHSQLATVEGNLDGTSTVLHLLDGLLAPRLADLPRLDRALRRTRALVARHRGQRLGSLPRAVREQVDAEVDDLCERLAAVATMLEPRRTS